MVGKSILGASALLAVATAQNLNNNIANADGLELVPEALQLGSTFDGTDALGASDEQVASRISENNFINFCAGETLTNGLQITEGSCNGIPHGQIPAKNAMISSIIINPGPGDVIQSGQTFNIQVQMRNFVAGAFTNAFATYYSAPQFLSDNGLVIGHTHVTVQDLGSDIAPTQPPDPEQFAFFKGINDAGNGQLLLEAVVEEGLPPGNYRVCTIVSASNHQPVVMPVAQRGAQDDCNKFTVVGDDFDVNDAANNGDGGIEAAADAQEAVDLGPGAIDPNADAADDAEAQDAQAQDAQGQDAQGQDAQGQDAQGQDAQGQDAQGQDAQGQDAQGQDAQGQDAQGQDAQGQDAQGQDAQGQDAQGQNGQGQNAQGQDAQGQDAQGQDGQGQDAQGQDAQGQGAQGQEAQGQGAQGQGAQGQEAQGQDAQGQDAQGQDAQGQDAQGQDAQGQDAQGQNNNQSAQGGAPNADQLRQQAESFFGNGGQNV